MPFHLCPLCGGVVALSFLAGCDESSISSDNPYTRSSYVGGSSGGEIDEMDLLGSHGASEADIHNALRKSSAGGVSARPGSSLLLVQSGASVPDSIMIEAAEKRYRVFPFSSSNSKEQTAGSHRNGALARDFRLAAARSGCSHILCYWGKLESIHEDQVTKTVSWVPIVGNLVPDDGRTTRLRVRAILIDVASGRTAAFTPPAAENSALSPGLLRDSSRDKQVYRLKTQAYVALVDELAGGGSTAP